MKGVTVEDDLSPESGNCPCGCGQEDHPHIEPAVEGPSRLLGKSTGPEQQFVLGLAYQAGQDPRIAKGADGARDFFTAEELEKACWSFLPGGAQVGLFHGSDATLGHMTVTESYIYRGPDWDQPDGTVIKAGDWLIGGICDDIAWDLVKTGKVTGFSPQGQARRRTRRRVRSSS